jgi:hypothetical protein
MSQSQMDAAGEGEAGDRYDQDVAEELKMEGLKKLVVVSQLSPAKLSVEWE